MATRYDRGTLKPPTRLADGRLRCDGYLTRSGVFNYQMPDGSTLREYRPPEEVFKADALESFALVPVTDNHPEQFLSASNAKQYAVGMVGESIRQDGSFVAASMVVFDEKTIAKMDAGKVELSCGYEVDLVHKAGVTDTGEEYDAIQTNIRGNHVALVDVGRAGPDARVRMDAATQIRDEISMDLKQALQEAAEAKAALGIEQKARADADEKTRSLESELSAAKIALAEAQGKVDAAEKARADAEGSFADKVRTRVALEASAARFGVDPNGKSDRDVKVAVVDAAKMGAIEPSKSDDYVQALFDHVVSNGAKVDANVAAVRGAIVDAKPATDEDPEVKARAEMIARYDAQWKAARGY